MEIKKNERTSCWKSKENSTGTVDKIILCPICKGKTQAVKNITVKHFVVDNLVNQVRIGKHSICLNEECNVVYFNQNRNVIFRIKDIKIPIWFKKDADPKYICYCNKVTEQEIIEAVLLKEAKTLKDVMKITGAMKDADCVNNNPIGKCCSPIIQDIIHKTLIIKNENL